jgi:hypothetical protein
MSGLRKCGRYVAIFCLISCTICLRPAKAGELQPSLAYENYYFQQGVLTRQEAARMFLLEESITASGRVTDKQLNWVITTAKSPGLNNSIWVQQQRPWALLRTLCGVKQFTLQQKKELEPVLLSELPCTFSPTRVCAIALLSKAGCERDVPIVEHYLNDPNPYVRIASAKTVARIRIADGRNTH